MYRGLVISALLLLLTTVDVQSKSTGGCVSTCESVPNGDYQSCQGCNVYATCSNELLYDNRPCPASLVWDDVVKRCEWTSSTCGGVPEDSVDLSTDLSGCKKSCKSIPNGDYQSCNGCKVYATCSNGFLYDNRPCPAGLVWDDVVKRCEWTSNTCGGEDTEDSNNADDTESPNDPGTAATSGNDEDSEGASGCVKTCASLADGDYQSCQGCNVYATCSNGILYNNRPCNAGLVWDDVEKRCEWTSNTCGGEDTEDSSNTDESVDADDTENPNDSGTSETSENGEDDADITGCVESCESVPDGYYQSCKGCNVYATCSNGILYDNRPCPAGLVWDDVAKQCEWTSSTCGGSSGNAEDSVDDAVDSLSDDNTEIDNESDANDVSSNINGSDKTEDSSDSNDSGGNDDSSNSDSSSKSDESTDSEDSSQDDDSSIVNDSSEDAKSEETDDTDVTTNVEDSDSSDETDEGSNADSGSSKDSSNSDDSDESNSSGKSTKSKKKSSKSKDSGKSKKSSKSKDSGKSKNSSKSKDSGKSKKSSKSNSSGKSKDSGHSKSSEKSKVSGKSIKSSKSVDSGKTSASKKSIKSSKSNDSEKSKNSGSSKNSGKSKDSGTSSSSGQSSQSKGSSDSISSASIVDCVEIECSSWNFAYAECPTENKPYGTISLVQQVSVSSCNLGDSYGLNNNGVWVDKGCRGSFTVCTSGDSSRGGKSGDISSSGN